MKVQNGTERYRTENIHQHPEAKIEAAAADDCSRGIQPREETHLLKILALAESSRVSRMKEALSPLQGTGGNVSPRSSSSHKTYVTQH
jgi:hypothetical protein